MPTKTCEHIFGIKLIKIPQRELIKCELSMNAFLFCFELLP